MKKRKNTGKITLADVAKLAKVSPMTVSRTLKDPDLVSEELRAKINDAIQALGYVPNIIASNLASSNTKKTILIIHHDLLDDLLTSIVNYVEDHLSEHYIFIKQKESSRQDLFSHAPSLIILVNTKPHMQHVTFQHIPMLSIGIHENDTINLTEIYISSIYHLTKFVIDKGFHNIGFLCITNHSKAFQNFLYGWNKCIYEHNLLSHRIISINSDQYVKEGAASLPEFILNWPETNAIICNNDQIACGVIFECQRRKIKVPEDISVVSLGSNADFEEAMYPSLTTLSLQIEALNKKIIEAITISLNNKVIKKTIITPNKYVNYHIEVRQSLFV